MTVTAAIVGVITVLFLAVAISAFPDRVRMHLSVAGLMISLAVVPRNVVSLGEPDPGFQVGIALAAPSLRTYTIVILVILVCLLLRGSRLPIAVFVPFIVYVFVFLFVWDLHSWTLSGVLHLVVACLFWAVGMVGAEWLEDSEGMGGIIAGWVLLLGIFQSTVCALQTIGVDIFPAAAESIEFEGARANGSFSHPGTVGKVLFFAAILVMPFTTSDDSRTRRRATLAILSFVPAFLLSEGRANAFAFAGFLVIWALLDRSRGRIKARVAVTGLVGIAAYASYGLWVNRFATGEDGTYRSRLLSAGLEQLMRDPWVGTGPNGYVATVGQWDALTSTGFPVHNIYVLAAAELGLVGAVFLLAPLITTFIVAVPRLRRPGLSGSFARSVVAAAPGFALITVTGWGVLGDALPLCFLVFGFARMAGGQHNSQVDVSSVQTHRLSSVDGVL